MNINPSCRDGQLFAAKVYASTTLPVCPLLPLIPSAPTTPARHPANGTAIHSLGQSTDAALNIRSHSAARLRREPCNGHTNERLAASTASVAARRTRAHRQTSQGDRRTESNVRVHACVGGRWLQQRRAIIPWSWRRTRYRKAVTGAVVSGGEHKECSILRPPLILTRLSMGQNRLPTSFRCLCVIVKLHGSLTVVFERRPTCLSPLGETALWLWDNRVHTPALAFYYWRG